MSGAYKDDGGSEQQRSRIDSRDNHNNDDDGERLSIHSTSTTSLILERIHPEDRDVVDDDDDDDETLRPESSSRSSARAPLVRGKQEEYDDGEGNDSGDEIDSDVEIGKRRHPMAKPVETKVKRMVYIIGVVMVGGWLVALGVYLSHEYYRFKELPHNPAATATVRSGKTITLDQVMNGAWRSYHHTIDWMDGADGKEDGLMLTQNYESEGKGWLVVNDLKDPNKTVTLMRSKRFQGGADELYADKVWPSPDLKKVLVAVDTEDVSKSRFLYVELRHKKDLK